MKKCFYLLYASILVGLVAQSQEPLNVMSFNIRLNTASDSSNAWPNRKDKVALQILFHDTHILGVQEALHDQMMDLQQRLVTYKSIGGGRDDGKTKGEYSAIFYDVNRLKVLESATFWLSLTPEVPGSKSWDAAITRIVTWGKFRDRKTKKTFFVFNTHFDHLGKEARKQSALLLLSQVDSIAGKTPVIIMGDFNAAHTEEPIMILKDENNPLHFTDAKLISEAPHYGPSGTFNGFKSAETSNQPIDYIFVKKDWRILKHATISQTWNGKFASDHFSVFVKAVLK